MKPFASMEDSKSDTAAQRVSAAFINALKKTYVKRVLIVVVVMTVVVSGIVIGAVYTGVSISQTIQKEALVEFQTASGQQIYEKILVTDREEMFETPGITAVFDFKTNLMVLKYANAAVCYVSHFKTSDMVLPGQLYSNLTATEMTVSTNDPLERVYHSTGLNVSLDQLSDRGQNLCRTSNVFWVVEQTTKESPATRRRRTVSHLGFCFCICCKCCIDVEIKDTKLLEHTFI